MTTTTTIQVQNCMGQWENADLQTLTWDGAPVQLTSEQRAALDAGRVVRFGNDWYANIRRPRTARPVYPTHQFTCQRCGGHRDTTISGRCDDCAS